MSTQDFTTTFVVNKTPQEVFDAVNNVREWWSEGVEGGTHQLNDEFVYVYQDLHYSKQKLIEVVPNKKVVWLVTDSQLNFVNEKNEWTGTKISFEIAQKDNQTQLRFTHLGLVPENECFDACSGGWTTYINSLQKLISTGKGKPDKKAMK